MADVDTSTITVSCRIKPDVADKYKAAWENQEKIVISTIKTTVVYAAAALLLMIFLLCVCGKNKDGEYGNMWIDNIWAEIHLAAVAGSGVGAAAVCAIVLDKYMSGHFPHNLIDLVIGAAAALGSLMIITSLLSIIRSIKNRRLLETSLICIVLRWIFRAVKWCFGILVKILKWIGRQTKAFWGCMIGMLSRKSGVILAVMLFVYTSLIGICGIFLPEGPVWLIFGILLFGFACFVIAHRAKDLDEIKKGVGEVCRDLSEAMNPEHPKEAVSGLPSQRATRKSAAENLRS